MGRNNKYHKFPARRQISVGEFCLLCQCNRQVRKMARPIVQSTSVRSNSFFGPITNLSPGMILSGVNNLTNELEVFKVVSVDIGRPDLSGVERIK